MTTPTDQLVADLRRRREALGMTQAALAERVGCASMHVANIEAGRRWPRPDLLNAIAHALQVELRARAMDGEGHE